MATIEDGYWPQLMLGYEPQKPPTAARNVSRASPVSIEKSPRPLRMIFRKLGGLVLSLGHLDPLVW
jgi:hypothetical protein